MEARLLSNKESRRNKGVGPKTGQRKGKTQGQKENIHNDRFYMKSYALFLTPP